jgi:hypothetical protein
MNSLKPREINRKSLSIKEKFELLINKYYILYKGEEYVKELEDIELCLKKLSSLSQNLDDEENIKKIEKILEKQINDNRKKDIKLLIFELFHLIELILKGINLL